MNWLVLMKLYTAVVFDLRMCMKDINPSTKTREIIKGR